LFVFSLKILAGCSNAASGNSGSSIVQITPSSVVVFPGQSFQFAALTPLASAPSLFQWQVNGVTGGSPDTGTISTDGMYQAPPTTLAQPVGIGIRGQQATASVYVFDSNHPYPGAIASTQNPLVASYTIVLLKGASVHIQFGLDTSYGLSTSTVSAPEYGGSVTILVAGMLASSTYHMQAVIQLSNGTEYRDSDHTFVTGATNCFHSSLAAIPHRT
jgi:hypothetical protein